MEGDEERRRRAERHAVHSDAQSVDLELGDAAHEPVNRHAPRADQTRARSARRRLPPPNVTASSIFSFLEARISTVSSFHSLRYLVTIE